MGACLVTAALSPGASIFRIEVLRARSASEHEVVKGLSPVF
jgi:hypothetical protein